MNLIVLPRPFVPLTPSRRHAQSARKEAERKPAGSGKVNPDEIHNSLPAGRIANSAQIRRIAGQRLSVGCGMDGSSAVQLPR
jgi:hypothetical protein